jgi:predicted transcriptional regulator/DNA-binding XRE family transcriptional regulator
MTPDRKLFAGARLRRLRLQLALTQTRMADDLGVSVSYLNLIERNQRPLSAAFLLKLANVYNLDLRQLTGDDADAVTSELAAVFADPLLGGLEVSRAELGEVAASAPGVAQALLRLYAARGTAAPDHAAATGPVEAMTELLLERRNHFPDLDAAAERLADDLRLAAGDLTAALAERLRVRHGLTVRTLPSAVMPDLLRRLDLHARQLQLSEGLDAASRTFAIAYQVALIELKPEIDAVIATAALPSAAHQRFALQTLANYAAAAVMMPYARFHAAAEALGYDLELLQARFGAGFEQVAHRLTTLQRPGMRGVPFLMIRTDRAGNVSKRFSAVRSALASDGGGCPLWVLHAAFDRPGRIMRQVVETEDGQRYLSVARTVRTYATAYGTVKPEFTILLSCELAHARTMIYADGLDTGPAAATPIGLGCARCGRTACRQRSLVPAGARLSVDERSRGVTPFRFISPGES